MANNKDGPLSKVRIFDGFDVFITLVALVAVLLSLRYEHIAYGNRLAGLNGIFTRNKVEKLLKKVDGVKSAEMTFEESYGQYTAVAVLYPWAGNYNIYESKTVNEIKSIITHETGIQDSYITLYDGDTGEVIYGSDMPKNGGGSELDNSIQKFFEEFWGVEPGTEDGSVVPGQDEDTVPNQENDAPVPNKGDRDSFFGFERMEIFYRNQRKPRVIDAL